MDSIARIADARERETARRGAEREPTNPKYRRNEIPFESFDRDDVPYDRIDERRNPEEYWRRIVERVPLKPPMHHPGALVFVPMRGVNMPVVAVIWQRGPGQLPHWHVWVPGLGADECNFQPARADKPTERYVGSKGGHSWKCVETLQPTEGV